MKYGTSLFLLLLISSVYLLQAPAFADAPRIIDVELYDRGNTSSTDNTFSVDVIQNKCGQDTANKTPEPFYDTLLKVKVNNNQTSILELVSFQYTLRLGSGKKFSSRKLAASNTGSLPAKSDQQLLLLLFKSSNGLKYFTGSKSPISSSLGFKTVTLILTARNALGTKFTIRKSFALSFGDFDRCA